MSKENGVLDLVLKAEWYNKIDRGEKTVEYREVKKFWNDRIYEKLLNHNQVYAQQPMVDKVLFSKGHRRKEQMLFKIKKIDILPSGSNTDLATDNPVFAIELGRRLNIVEWKIKEARKKGGKNGN